MAALTAEEQEVLTALQEAGVRDPQRFRGFLARLHASYYRTLDDFKQATRAGLAEAGLPPGLVDAVMACQAGAASGSGQAGAGAGAGAAAGASHVPASATVVDRVLLVYSKDGVTEVEQATALVDGKLHLPTVESDFNITNVLLNGMRYSSAADGLTLNTFRDGARIVVTGTPRVADPDPPSLLMSLPFADGEAQLSLLTGQKLRKRAVQAGDAGVLSFF